MPDNPFARYRPAGGGPVYGAPPKAPTPVEQERLGIERERLGVSQRTEQRQSDKDAREASEENRRQAQTYEAARTNIERVIRKIDEIARDADDNSGWGETGTSGKIMRNLVPMVQTPGKDLDANLNTLRANLAFDALSSMREASKTGGALGAITERELKLLEDSVANISPDQSHEQFLQNLGEARAQYLLRLRRIDPETAERLSALRGRNRGAARRSNPDDIEEIMRKYGND